MLRLINKSEGDVQTVMMEIKMNGHSHITLHHRNDTNDADVLDLVDESHNNEQLVWFQINTEGISLTVE